MLDVLMHISLYSLRGLELINESAVHLLEFFCVQLISLLCELDKLGVLAVEYFVVRMCFLRRGMNEEHSIRNETILLCEDSRLEVEGVAVQHNSSEMFLHFR